MCMKAMRKQRLRLIESIVQYPDNDMTMNMIVNLLIEYCIEINLIFGVFLLTCLGLTLGIGSSSGVWVTELPILPLCILVTLMTLWLWSDKVDQVDFDAPHGLYGILCVGLVLVLVLLIFIGLHLSNRRPGEQYFEYGILVLLGTFGLDILLTTNNFALFFVGLELNSLCVYVLAGYDIRSIRSRQAGLKYFVLGSFSSSTFLFGIAILYSLTCFIDFTDYSTLLTIQSIPAYMRPGVLSGVSICILGLAFKIYSAPFHFWVVDVYNGAPWCALLYIGSVSPVALLYTFRRVHVDVFASFMQYTNLLLEVLCCITLLIGACGGILQRNIRKILAYSSISTTGFFLSSLSVSDLSLQLYSYEYTFLYAITVIAVVLISHNCNIESDSPCTIDWLLSLCARNRKLACYFVSFFSLIGGLPPFSLSFSKYAMSALFCTTFMHIVSFVVLLAGLITLFVYYRFIQNIYYSTDRKRCDEGLSPKLPYGLEIFLFLLIVFQSYVSLYGGLVDVYFYLLLVG